ncbi:hypothetical protein P154DRAFT_581613 [Amniculicola lignicola CBS 123094]|uniref:CHAT domain-containing protein n=1 Tax=Amniculicola lignicola CBS 123094 TaxID=1392246 RepID=A0A6A5W6A2_9PLEO|nr:hypothetical protein P154DRAFT_581613 [Amniculicola lignicola CBS 123094]
MGDQCSFYDQHLLSHVTNKCDQNIIVRAAELQSHGRLHDAALQYENLQESRSVSGVVVYESRLLLMKGDFKKASSTLDKIIGPTTKITSSPTDALIILMKAHCNCFLHLHLQEAVDTARAVWEAWLGPAEVDKAPLTDTHVLLEYYYQGIITLKSMLQERRFVDTEQPTVLKARRVQLYNSLVLQGRVHEAFEVARMEMKFGASTIEQLRMFQSYLELCKKGPSVGAGISSYPLNLYEQSKPICAAHIHISIGKTLCKLDRQPKGAQSFQTALDLFSELDSTNGKALARMQIAFLDKSTVTALMATGDNLQRLAGDFMKTCNELQSLVQDLIDCKDWIGTNSALGELSEMLQCGPPFLQPKFQACQREIKKIYDETGNKFNFWHMQSQVWQFEFTKPSSFGKGIEMCEGFFKDDRKDPTSNRLLKEIFATMLMVAYEAIGDDVKAEDNAKLCLSLTKEVGDRRLIIANEISVARFRRKRLRVSETLLEIEKNTTSLAALFHESSGIDGKERLADYHDLVSLTIYLADLWTMRWDRSGVEEHHRERFLENALHWIETGLTLIPHVGDDVRSSSRGALDFVHAGILRRMDRTAETIRLCQETLSTLNGETSTRDKANTQQLLASTLMIEGSQNPSMEIFNDAKGAYLEAIKAARELGDMLMAAGCLKALVKMVANWPETSLPTKISLPDVLGWTQEWDDIWEEILSEASTYHGLKGLEVRQRLREKNSTDLYRIAIELCMNENDILQAWQWTQKAKARAVATSLGLSRLVPSNMSRGFSQNSLELLDREHALLDVIENSDERGRFHLRMEHFNLRQEMNSIPELRPIQAIRQGGNLEIVDLDCMFGGRKDILCVDWVEREDGTYHIIAVRPGELPQYFATEVTVAEVQEWLECYIYAEDSVDNLEDAIPEEMEVLDGLVSPLSDIVAKGDLLIFVPTGLLCAVPLHALSSTRNGGRNPVIEWNPVVYSNSLAISRQVFTRATNSSSSKSNKKCKVAVFGNPTPEHKTESKMAVEIGEYLKADIFMGEDATSHALRAAMQDDKLIHYHGHAQFDSSDILNNSVLSLYDGNVSVKHLFESSVLQSPHITLIACHSGQQKITIGDEPLGFFTALTVAGAGSVLGNLWELDDLHASSTFTKHFYKDLGNNIQAGKTNFVFDLALAHQKAVREMRASEKTRGLYYWAGIILYGSPWLIFS